MIPKTNHRLSISYFLVLAFVAIGGYLLFWKNYASSAETFAQVPHVPSGVFSYSGSAEWSPIQRTVDAAIEVARPEFQLRYVLPNVVAPTSGTGIKMLQDGKVAFVQSTLPLGNQDYTQAKQRGYSIKQIPVAIDGIVVAVNPKLNIQGLTIAQLKSIYTGKVTNWKQVGGPNLKITPYSPPVNTEGTVQFFREDILGGEAFGANIEFVYTSTKAIAKLQRNVGAIYYASAPALVPQCSVKTLPIGRTNSALISPYQEPFVPNAQCPAKRNQPNLDAFQNAEYPLTRNLFVVIKQDGGVEEKAGKAYANFLLSQQGQDLIKKAGFANLRPNQTSTGFKDEPKGSAVLVQATPAPKPTPQIIVQPQEVRALPGKLDNVPMFNSNSPEWVKTEGILLSTFPSDGKKVPAAHLNFPFQGRFDVFVHHQTHTPKDLQTFYLGVMLHNPGKQPITVEVLEAATYLTQEAPYITLPTYVENPENTAYAGPGDRAVHDVLQGKRQPDFPAKLVIPPGQSRMMLNHPTPVRDLEKPINGRSVLMRLNSSGTVYAASLTMFAKKNPDGSDRAPTLEEWQTLLNTGSLAGPRDKAPTPPEQTSGQLIYGRVAGVQQGSKWQGQLVYPTGAKDLTIPQPGKAVSYALNTLRGGRLGTEQVQTAKMLVRYPDTAYEAHGNYAVEYNLSLPLYNPTDKPQTVALTIETPLKEDKLSRGGLLLQKPSRDFPFFRGTVRLRYKDDQGKEKTRYVHLWHRTGQVLEPLESLVLPAGSRKQVQVDFIYPPDSTPPQVLTVRTVLML